MNYSLQKLFPKEGKRCILDKCYRVVFYRINLNTVTVKPFPAGGYTMSIETVESPRILFIASECARIARTGGLGDVVHDLSRVLRQKGISTAVIMPGYSSGSLTGEFVEQYKIAFGGKSHKVKLHALDLDGVTVFQIRSKTFFEKEYGTVYIDSGSLDRGPFEDDAKRFAFFSKAAAEIIHKSPLFQATKILHCHDWHTGVFLTLLKMDPQYAELAQRVRTVFTIHNLGYQGVRPFVYAKEKLLMSFSSWFPQLYREMVATPRIYDIRDPLAEIPCFNPIKAGIRLADLVTTVSPTYAHEITLPNDPGNRFTGGNGMERDLTQLARRGRLTGILNGIDYTDNDPAALIPPYISGTASCCRDRKKFTKSFLERLPERLALLAEESGDRFKNSGEILKRKPMLDAAWKKRPLVVFISRAVDQKAGILFEEMSGGKNLLDRILNRELSLIVLASGELEENFRKTMDRDNALFINAFDRKLATDLYGAGDLLLLPSYFEPCGISQLIAMRYGCLPLVHEIGGLHDTVKHRKTGFSYHGVNLEQQQRSLLRTLDSALKLWQESPERWEEMIRKAMDKRFTWEAPARTYIQLYSQLTGLPMVRSEIKESAE